MAATLRVLQKMREEREGPSTATPMIHRPLMITKKGASFKSITILEDLIKMVPHSRRDTPVLKSEMHDLEIVASDDRCDTIFLLETNNKTDSYFWAARTHEGPSVRMAMREGVSIRDLRQLGNCLKGSRPIITIDPELKQHPQTNLATELLIRVFSVPKGNLNAKPFVDHVLSFVYVDHCILVRIYQVRWDSDIVLVEIGPRLTLEPDLILAGTFRGSKIWNKPLPPKRNQNFDRAKSREKKAEQLQERLNIPNIEDPLKGLFAPVVEDQN